jgi:hypothetical protein
MVDKIWYNWQQLDPRNANSFFGGASEPTDNLTIYDEYPNGGPPFLTVSACNFTQRVSSRFDCKGELDHARGWDVSGTHHRRRTKHNRGRFVLCLRVTGASIQPS